MAGHVEHKAHETPWLSWPDGEIVRRVINGEAVAFEALMRRHNQMLFRAARSILKDDAEAEDAVQEAYLIAFRSIRQFRGEARLSTWLVSIVVNEALGRKRSNARNAVIVPFDNVMDDENSSLAISEDQPMPELPEQSTLRSEIRAVIEKRIDQLPDVFRTVFVLRALEEMSVEDAASCLNIPEATVRTRYFRARGMLRETLARDIDMATNDAFSFDGERCDRIVSTVLARMPDP